MVVLKKSLYEETDENIEEAIELAKSNTNNLLEATNYEQALKEAEAITEVKEEEFFKGIPYIAKDNISTEGLETNSFK